MAIRYYVPVPTDAPRGSVLVHRQAPQRHAILLHRYPNSKEGVNSSTALITSPSYLYDMDIVTVEQGKRTSCRACSSNWTVRTVRK